MKSQYSRRRLDRAITGSALYRAQRCYRNGLLTRTRARLDRPENAELMEHLRGFASLSSPNGWQRVESQDVLMLL